MQSIEPSHFPATSSAGVAASNINYKLGGPNRLFESERVITASKESIAGVGNKYRLSFYIKDSLNEKPKITCTAEVLYHSDKKTPPTVTFSLQPEPQNYTAEKDQEFFKKMMDMNAPLEAADLPDSFGEIPPDMLPVFHLGVAAGAYIKWTHSTEKTKFAMTIVKHAKLQKANDHLKFIFTLLIHDKVSEEIVPWEIVGKWSPSGGIQIEAHKQLGRSYRDLQ